MNHTTNFRIDVQAPSQNGPGLGSPPNAPLPMPKQVLERSAGWLGSLRSLLTGTFVRS